MLSLAPTLVLIVAVAGVIVGQQSVRSEIMNQVTLVAGPDAAGMVSDLINNATQLGAGLVATLASTALIIFGASGAFLQLYDSLNAIWELEPYADRSGIVAMLLKRGIAILMVMAIGFALIATLLINTILSAVTTEIELYLPGIQLLTGLINTVVSLAVITGLFALLFKYVPAGRVRWRDILPGAFVTGLLFTIGENLISFYFRRSSIGSVYGAAGSLVILMLWIYYSTQILFFGAELTFVYARRYGQGIHPAANAHRAKKHAALDEAGRPEPVEDTTTPVREKDPAQ